MKQTPDSGLQDKVDHSSFRSKDLPNIFNLEPGNSGNDSRYAKLGPSMARLGLQRG